MVPRPGIGGALAGPARGARGTLHAVRAQRRSAGLTGPDGGHHGRRGHAHRPASIGSPARDVRGGRGWRRAPRELLGGTRSARAGPRRPSRDQSLDAPRPGRRGHARRPRRGRRRARQRRAPHRPRAAAGNHGKRRRFGARGRGGRGRDRHGGSQRAASVPPAGGVRRPAAQGRQGRRDRRRRPAQGRGRGGGYARARARPHLARDVGDAGAGRLADVRRRRRALVRGRRRLRRSERRPSGCSLGLDHRGGHRRAAPARHTGDLDPGRHSGPAAVRARVRPPARDELHESGAAVEHRAPRSQRAVLPAPGRGAGDRNHVGRDRLLHEHHRAGGAARAAADLLERNRQSGPGRAELAGCRRICSSC